MILDKISRTGRQTRPFVAQQLVLSLLLCVFLFGAYAISGASAADFPVSSASDIQSILSSVGPGDTITMQDGTWNNQQINFSADGTSSQPITLRAQTPGQVILTGSSSLNISGDWLVADGLNFDGGALGAGDHVVEFRGSNGSATNSRLTNSAITNYNPSNPDTRYFWVSLYGNNNRVDNNTFTNQVHSGVTVTVWRNGSAPDNHLIDNNYFAGRPVGHTSNGFETIRIGDSSGSASSSYTTVENNLFENTDGEAEIISSKSGHNVFRGNTFREAAGTLTLRHGDDNVVEGNFFLGNNKNQTGGVRVIGENHTVANNYFQGTDGRAGGAISFAAGLPNTPLNGYAQVKNAVIAHNTIVNLADRAAITFDDGLGGSNNGGIRTLLPEDVTIANNLISSTADPLFEGNEGANWTWEGNIAWGQSLGPKAGDPGITVVNPQLSFDSSSGVFRPGSNSPAIDGSSGNYSSATGNIDMDGQARIGLADVGADEFSTATIVRKPLVAADVGYDWTGGGNNNGGGGTTPTGCLTDGVAIQSDDYTAALDPNNDGDTWFVSSDADALGGTTMVAPDGPRVNLPGTHDAIMTYDLEFLQAGNYTAYYRGRGFNGSSDSLYTPDDFAVDPDNNESLSNNGAYRWETGGSFQITNSEVGIPLEFRIGMRESDANFDAFVLHLDSSLSASELDALFSVTCEPIDFNSDGVVDCSDIDALVSEIVANTNGAAFDLNGDGAVNTADLTVWLTDAGAHNLASGNAYLPGDANLDGAVDNLDFDIWNTNRFTQTAAWCFGDFNVDGVVDVSDFNIWNANKGQSALAVSVPEPSPGLAFLLGSLLVLFRGRGGSRIKRS